MRVLITLDGSEIGESAAAAVAEWALESRADIVLTMVIHPEDIKQTRSGEYHHTLTPKGTMGGHLISLEEPQQRMAETREQALERARIDAEAYLSKVAEHYLPGAPAQPIVEWDDDVAGAIVRAADKSDVAFIAMGTHGRTGLGHAILGSVAEEVVRRAHVPVLVIGPKTRERLGAASTGDSKASR